MMLPMAVLWVILGTTASGKSAAGMALAARAGATPIELVSCDSMKIYRGMDVGTNKPSPADRRRVPWHLLDVADPADPFTAHDYVRVAEAAIADIRARGAQPVLVGGTALYLMGLLEGFFEGPGRDEALRTELEALAHREGSVALHRRLSAVDPAAAARLHPNDRRRLVRALEVYHVTGTPISALQTQWDQPHPPRHEAVLVGLRRPKADEDRRMDARVERMIANGLVDEVRGLVDPARHPRGLGPQAAQAVGYAEMLAHLRGELGLAETVALIQRNTRKFAKAQRTWFKRLSRTHGVNWVDVGPQDTPASVAERIAAAVTRPPGDSGPPRAGHAPGSG